MSGVAAFFHDHIFHVDVEGHIYSPGRLPYSAFKRYLSVFDEVVIVARSKIVDDSGAGLELSSGPRLRFFLSQQPGSRFGQFVSVPGLRSEVRRQVSSVDAVIVRLPSYRGVLAADAAFAQGKPVAAEVVGLAQEGYQAHKSLLLRLYGRWMEYHCKRVLASCTHAIYVTDRFLQRRYPCPGVTAAASNVLLPDRNEAWLSSRLAKTISETRNYFTLGFVGSLSGSHKGLDLAIRLIVGLQGRGISARLKVAGDGNQVRWRQQVARLGLEDRIEFLGALPGVVAVTEWMREIDLLLHPSRSEGLPRAVVEAMWVGCPVAASRAGGTSELLDSSALHEVDDARALERVVLRMLQEPNLRAWMIKRNWDYSARFAPCKLDATRANFWRSFADSAI